MIKCAIVEDEDNSRNLLVKLLSRYCPDIQVIGTASSVEEAVTLINSEQPDLVFLDVVIIGGTGFDVLAGIDHKKTGVIFTTGYDEYAIKAIKYSAIDYLSKPIDFEELIDAVNKFKETNLLAMDERQEALKANSFQKKNFDSLIIPSLKGFKLYNVKDILWIRSEGSYSTFKINNEQIVASKPIGHFEEILPPGRFFRIHNRIIVNIEYIKEYLKGKGGSVILVNGEELDVSERRKDGLLKMLYS